MKITPLPLCSGRGESHMIGTIPIFPFSNSRMYKGLLRIDAIGTINDMSANDPISSTYG